MCAITAGKRDRRILLLERTSKIGKKILMSGGGRCNFTNLDITPSNYISSNSHFCKSALAQYTQWDFINLLKQHSIAYHEKIDGQLFCDNSSKDVLAMLESECSSVNVEIKTDCTIDNIDVSDGFNVSTASNIYRCDKLVIATGGLSIPTLGGSDFGYQIAKQFAHKLTPRRAGLVPLVFTDRTGKLMSNLSGLSIPANMKTGGVEFAGDILFTHRGLSGPAILQLSSYWREGEKISLDLLPDNGSDQLLLDAKRDSPGAQITKILSALLPKRLVTELIDLWWPQYKNTALTEIPDQKLQALQTLLHNWVLTPAGTEGYRTAEVTLGGVDTNELSSKTMESKLVPDLYFIGEVIDVTGNLGGYNFQWAWSSGYAAGQAV